MTIASAANRRGVPQSCQLNCTIGRIVRSLRGCHARANRPLLVETQDRPRRVLLASEAQPPQRAPGADQRHRDLTQRARPHQRVGSNTSPAISRSKPGPNCWRTWSSWCRCGKCVIRRNAHCQQASSSISFCGRYTGSVTGSSRASATTSRPAACGIARSRQNHCLRCYSTWYCPSNVRFAARCHQRTFRAAGTSTPAWLISTARASTMGNGKMLRA